MPFTTSPSAATPLSAPATLGSRARRVLPVLLVAKICTLALAAALALGAGMAPQAHAASPAASAAMPAEQASEFERAWKTFQQATQGGDENSIEPAAAAFGALSQAHMGDPVLLAYAGAATTMRATTTMLPWKKMRFADDGLAMLDKSLALLTPAQDAPLYRGTPASLEVKLSAATTFLALPGMFNREPRGQKLLAEVLASPLLGASPVPFKAAVWMTAARQAAKEKRMDEAKRLLQQVIAAGAPQAPAAQTLLKEWGG